jgi:hypothetical protein
VNESEWLVSDEPREMFTALRGLTSDGSGREREEKGGPPAFDTPRDRLMRLYAVACARLLPDPNSEEVKALATAEAMADGAAPWSELRPTRRSHRSLRPGVSWCLHRNPTRSAFLWCADGVTGASSRHNAARADLLREVFRSPYRPRSRLPERDGVCPACGGDGCVPPPGGGLILRVCPDCGGRKKVKVKSWLRWRDGLLLKLAREAYAGLTPSDPARDEGRLRMLSDCVEEAAASDPGETGRGEAGPAEKVIADHLRSGTHVKGCWALDALLGR